MTTCAHCGQRLVTLDEFTERGSVAVSTFRAEFTDFLKDMKDVTYATDAVHESSRWCDFILWLLGRNKLEFGDLREFVKGTELRLGAVVTDRSKYEH